MHPAFERDCSVIRVVCGSVMVRELPTTSSGPRIGVTVCCRVERQAF